MRNEAPALLPIFRSQNQAEMLMWLFLHATEEFSISELAAKVNAPVPTMFREVERLEDAGLLNSRMLGRNRMVQINRDHPAAEPLARLLEVTFGPRFVVEQEFGRLGAEKVILFGSWAARHSGKTGISPSDVDVLVVGDVKRADVYAAADRAQERLGIQVNPVISTAGQWSYPQNALILQIQSDAYLIVIDNND